MKSNTPYGFHLSYKQNIFPIWLIFSFNTRKKTYVEKQTDYFAILFAKPRIMNFRTIIKKSIKVYLSLFFIKIKLILTLMTALVLC